MDDSWVRPDRLFDGQDIVTDKGVRIVDGVVAEIGTAPADAVTMRGCLTIGFVDLQVNGGGGVLLNNDPTYAGMQNIAKAHRTAGTVAIMPTVITDAPQVLEQAAAAALTAQSDAGIIGLHIEGPHICMAKRGTHSARHVRPLDQVTVDIIRKLRDHDVTVKITLAPEAATTAQIEQLAQTGTIVSLGHTDAAAHDIQAAIMAGATCATHLFNAMSQMTGRAPNAVGAIINSDIYASIICDGHHVDDRMIALALRSRPHRDRMFIVSDAMATVQGPDEFTLYGETIRVQDGRLINAAGALAGAHVTQAQAVRRLVQQVGIAPVDALRMAVSVPAAVVGRPELAQMIGRPVADIVQLDDDLHVTGTLAGF